MRTSILSVLMAVSLAVSSAFAAGTVHPVVAMGDGQIYKVLYTESSWMSLAIPLRVLGGDVPSDVSLSVSGLPDGTTITLDSVRQVGGMLLLEVTVSRDDDTLAVYDTAIITVKSGDQILTTLSIPVMGAAY
ncbi:hypothetical protein [Deinococcus aerophilus]|uniref:Uncharacterized protein n=1 Tax=Deinococcus aerophilus TaxID=522488 RepID=A0ABQ2H042_9DEIO|nr:hypothetical protein [Deinococcus aerophilus]GGM20002.1 hypothetical protein GCM10010841_30070 [Deinococcus aerophilus]